MRPRRSNDRAGTRRNLSASREACRKYPIISATAFALLSPDGRIWFIVAGAYGCERKNPAASAKDGPGIGDGVAAYFHMVSDHCPEFSQVCDNIRAVGHHAYGLVLYLEVGQLRSGSEVHIHSQYAVPDIGKVSRLCAVQQDAPLHLGRVADHAPWRPLYNCP